METTAWVLVAGFALFVAGAGAWRLEYEQAPEDALPVMHADRARLRWIHGVMLPAVAFTVAGLWGLASIDPMVAVGAGLYAVGAVPWMLALAFRLSVGEWAAERTATDGRVPEVYEPLARWAGLGHPIHMATAYLATIPLALGLADSGLVAGWLPTAGIVWAGILGLLFVIPRTRFVAAPPFWAHVFTFAVGLSLLLT